MCSSELHQGLGIFSSNALQLATAMHWLSGSWAPRVGVMNSTQATGLWAGGYALRLLNAGLYLLIYFVTMHGAGFDDVVLPGCQACCIKEPDRGTQDRLLWRIRLALNVSRSS